MHRVHLALVNRCIGESVHWCIGALVHSCIRASSIGERLPLRQGHVEAAKRRCGWWGTSAAAEQQAPLHSTALLSDVYVFVCV